MRWSNAKEIIIEVRSSISATISSSAAYRWLEKEQLGYDRSFGHRKQTKFSGWLPKLSNEKVVEFCHEPDIILNNIKVKFRKSGMHNWSMPFQRLKILWALCLSLFGH